ncbi:hypothetical protein AB0C02_31825 [Micromonospora sp. NPDC048999]|uniref:hypothetical protein n=1 Tax=Micromonospora sp. NPDC048999 TaxID=3155391 RepID=UPI0033D3F705
MAAFVGLVGVVLGALLSAVATYLTTRSTKRMDLEHSYDRALRDKRLESYQQLFHISRCLPRYWRPTEVPTRQDLRRFRQDFHDWYFGESAGGMFLTVAAKDVYMRLLNSLAQAIPDDRDACEQSEEQPLHADESHALRALASELRHQLSADVGAANPPQLQSTRLGRTAPPPPSISG